MKLFAYYQDFGMGAKKASEVLGGRPDMAGTSVAVSGECSSVEFSPSSRHDVPSHDERGIRTGGRGAEFKIDGVSVPVPRSFHIEGDMFEYQPVSCGHVLRR